MGREGSYPNGVEKNVPCIRLFKSSDDSQEGGFATPRWSEQKKSSPLSIVNEMSARTGPAPKFFEIVVISTFVTRKVSMKTKGDERENIEASSLIEAEGGG